MKKSEGFIYGSGGSGKGFPSYRTGGGSGILEIVYIEEMDPWGADDLGRWTNVTIPTGGATPNRKDLTTSDVCLRIRRTTEDT